MSDKFVAQPCYNLAKPKSKSGDKAIEVEGCEAGKTPSFDVVRCGDGEEFFTSKFWRGAGFAMLTANDGIGEPPLDTFFSLMYSDKYLYFMFDCIDIVPKATMTGYNQQLYDEEAVEFFFSPNCDGVNYLEVEFNHNNACFCANIVHSKESNKINFVLENVIESKVVKSGDNWRVYGRIPRGLFSDFDKKVWQFNAYRIKRDSKNEFLLSAFSPTLRPNFHTPEKFATLFFR